MSVSCPVVRKKGVLFSSLPTLLFSFPIPIFFLLALVFLLLCLSFNCWFGVKRVGVHGMRTARVHVGVLCRLAAALHTYGTTLDTSAASHVCVSRDWRASAQCASARRSPKWLGWLSAGGTVPSLDHRIFVPFSS